MVIVLYNYLYRNYNIYNYIYMYGYVCMCEWIYVFVCNYMCVLGGDIIQENSQILKIDFQKQHKYT